MWIKYMYTHLCNKRLVYPLKGLVCIFRPNFEDYDYYYFLIKQLTSERRERPLLIFLRLLLVLSLCERIRRNYVLHRSGQNVSTSIPQRGKII